MTGPDASVIVRTKDEVGSIRRCLELLRRQTAVVEIIVVDSGSTDGTLEIARDRADLVIEIPQPEFTYGRALNLGARAARAPVHAAVSAHTFLNRPDWIERAVVHQGNPRVAGVNGGTHLPDGTPQMGLYYQDAEASRRHRTWGFSNTASSWRAPVWEQFPFDEQLEACEDKEWSWRVLEAGWVIVFDPELAVPDRHRSANGIRELYRRERREAAALTTRGALPRSSTRAACTEWWRVPPGPSMLARWRQRLNYRRTVAIAGRHTGSRRA